MNEPASPNASPKDGSGLRWAGIIGVLIVAGLAGIVVLLAIDRGQRKSLETVSQTTAVGDTKILPHRTRGVAPEVALHGAKLVPPSPRHIEFPDSKMVDAGEVDGGGYRLYQPLPPEEIKWEKGEIEDKNRSTYYLKVGNGEYLRVQ